MKKKPTIHKFFIGESSIDIVTSTGRRITADLERFSQFITNKSGVSNWNRPLKWNDEGETMWYNTSYGGLHGVYEPGTTDILEYLERFHHEEVKPRFWEKITHILFGKLKHIT